MNQGLIRKDRDDIVNVYFIPLRQYAFVRTCQHIPILIFLNFYSLVIGKSYVWHTAPQCFYVQHLLVTST